MYGKLFERMYTGSMMGSGAMMFAVWPYVIAHMKPNRERTVFTVELNTELMALLIGEKEDEIAEVIKKCCEPDPKSRTPDNEGRKLVKLGTYLYEVVNGVYYDNLKRADDLREANRRRQEAFREKQKVQEKIQENGKVEVKRRADDVEIPLNLQTQAFKSAWGEWQEHLKQKKKPPTKIATGRQLKKLSEMGEGRAIAAIENSITNNWQGIFEKTGKGAQPTGHVSAC